MTTQTLAAAMKSLVKPDETRTFPNGKIELVHLGDTTIGKITLEPGWKWSKDVKPTVKTNSCMAPHTQYVLDGVLRVVMDDGDAFELKAGDAVVIPPGHDAWVVGDDAFVAIDFTGAKDYAKRA